ncbi:30S ribosomal protein S8 [Geobacillus sp. BCO2]|nr:30S ribosomal protein S8 [Geobacillus sp. BCO2]
MVMTDPIADMLTRIRNANMVRHEKLEVPASKIKREIAEILKREGLFVIMNISKTTNKAFSASS